jgi:hypothetical protein
LCTSATRVEPGLTDGHHLRADAVEFENIGKVARHRPPEPVERPHDNGVEGALFGVLHHLLVHGPTLGRRDVLLVHGDDAVPSGSGELLDLGALKVRGLFVGRDL